MTVDALELLTTQHREVEELFSEFEQLEDGAEHDRRREIAQEVIGKLVRHAEIEEQAFYPTVREVLPELEDEIAHDLEEHQEAEELLAQLERLDPDDAEFDATFGTLTADVRHHVEEEENDLFPQVREQLGEDVLADLGDAMSSLYETVPSRPHPRSPNEPPANVIAGPGAAALDRVRDAVRGLRGA